MDDLEPSLGVIDSAEGVIAAFPADVDGGIVEGKYFLAESVAGTASVFERNTTGCHIIDIF